MNETTATCISILLTVTLVLFLAAVAAFLLVSALNDRRQTAIAARDRRSSADRRAYEQWAKYYREEIELLRASAEESKEREQTDKKRIAYLERRLDEAARLDSRRVAKIAELERRLQEVGA